MKRIQNQESEQKEFKILLKKQIEIKNSSDDLLPVINHIANDFNSLYNLLDDYDKKELLHFLIKEIQVNTGEKPKDRTIKKIVYELDRKSTRLNSSHVSISYAVFCLKKKNNI